MLCNADLSNLVNDCFSEVEIYIKQHVWRIFRNAQTCNQADGNNVNVISISNSMKQPNHIQESKSL